MSYSAVPESNVKHRDTESKKRTPVIIDFITNVKISSVIKVCTIYRAGVPTLWDLKL